MDDPWNVKLERAHEHLRELRRALDELRSSGDFAVTIDERGGERVVRLVLKSEPPARLSAIVGDVVHNLRSSLDCVMLAACETPRPLTDPEERGSQFPITLTPTEFANAEWRIAPASDEVKELVRSMQPWYWITQGSAPPIDEATLREEVQHESLATLSYLSNQDKHRRIHLTAWYPKDIYIGTPLGIEARWRGATPSERQESEIGRWMITGDGAEDIDLHSNGEAGLAFRRYMEMGWHDVEVTGLLQGLVQHVEWVVGVVAVGIGRR